MRPDVLGRVELIPQEVHQRGSERGGQGSTDGSSGELFPPLFRHPSRKGMRDLGTGVRLRANPHAKVHAIDITESMEAAKHASQASIIGAANPAKKPLLQRWL